MKQVSVFNSVLGPVMRGPSSSHTAASYHIGRLCHDVLGEAPLTAEIAFDEAGSYAACFREQGSDLAFIAGLLGWDITDDLFFRAAEEASRQGVAVTFTVGPYPQADHPNWVRLSLRGRNNATCVTAASIGGGSVIIKQIDGVDVNLHGDSDCVLENGRVVRPIFYPLRGEPLWQSAAELAAYAEQQAIDLAAACLRNECSLLGISEAEAKAEMLRRYRVMKRSCERGLASGMNSSMQLLRPTAGKIFASGRGGGLPFFGLHSRAAARALAIMHANGAMEVVCAAPTGGSAGALPAVVMTLEEELGLSEEQAVATLFASSAVGVIFDSRATFAAEVAGCQVEIGAGGAMAAAACVYAAGGTLAAALDAASVSLQNTMGSVCDSVQGIVEIPCHTRNAAAAAAAFVTADLIIGGYEDSLPLDETIDASYAVGISLPAKLRCTAKGGLALCPSAVAMKRLNRSQ